MNLEAIIYQITNLLPYIALFPIITIFLVIIFSIVHKRKIDQHFSFYGLFLDLNNKDIFSLSLLFIYYIFIVESLFVNNFSLIHFLFLLLPITIFNIINKYIVNLLVNIINSCFIYALLICKSIFFNYLIDVTVVWYVVVILLLLSLFIFFYASYFFIRNYLLLLQNNKYVQRKVKYKSHVKIKV